MTNLKTDSRPRLTDKRPWVASFIIAITAYFVFFVLMSCASDFYLNENTSHTETPLGWILRVVIEGGLETALATILLLIGGVVIIILALLSRVLLGTFNALSLDNIYIYIVTSIVVAILGGTIFFQFYGSGMSGKLSERAFIVIMATSLISGIVTGSLGYCIRTFRVNEDT
jgi:hypothetical protein